MKSIHGRRTFLGVVAATFNAVAIAQKPDEKTGKGGGQNKKGGKGGGGGQRQGAYVLPSDLAAYTALSLVLGQVTDKSVTFSALAKEAMEGYIEYGTKTGQYSKKTKATAFPANEPAEWVVDGLEPDTEYFYRLQSRKIGDSGFKPRPECRFHTQRAAGQSFTFAVQGDSHPERPQMSEPNLYARTLLHVASSKPDFYICMGDDFSADKLRTVNSETVLQPYLLQRPFLGLIGQTAPLYLVNGNHEQASLFNFNQTDVRHELAVGVQNARNKLFPLPAPDNFYTGDAETFKGIGYLRDYYSWTWGDALFVVLDNYWHSPAMVDNGFAGGGDEKAPKEGGKNRDAWGVTIGDAQYKWFKKTLEQSKAKYRFVFAHHVMGSGRGGVEPSEFFEWGGKSRRGDNEFRQKRPGWELPIHQLMVKHGVNIFFQGHDHLYCKQERDGVIYQEVPMPGDHLYNTHNEEMYRTGVKLPNSGYLRIHVAPDQAKVEYVRSYLPKDEKEGKKTGDVAHTYTVKSRVGTATRG